MKDFIIKSGAKLIITDFNHLPKNPKDFWMNKYTNNYLVYDKANRFDKSDKIIKRDNTFPKYLRDNINSFKHLIKEF